MLSIYERAQALYEDEIEYARDEGREEGREEGKSFTIREIAKNMLRLGIDAETVSKSTLLSLDEVNDIILA